MEGGREEEREGRREGGREGGRGERMEVEERREQGRMKHEEDGRRKEECHR